MNRVNGLAYTIRSGSRVFAEWIEDQLSDPLFKVETRLYADNYTDEVEIRSRVREHMVEVDDFIERQLMSKGFVKLRPNEALGEWRKCPLCEIGSKEPHKCYDGMLLEPVER